MNYEDYLKAEHKLHLSTDKVYREHLKTVEALTKRQVAAQEQLVKSLKKLAQQDALSLKPVVVGKNAKGLQELERGK